MIELVIFDLAGTTIRDDGRIPAAFAAVLGKHGIVISDSILQEIRGGAKREIIAQFVKTDEMADKIYTEFRNHLFAAYENNGVREISGASAIFSQLKQRGIKIALNTGFDRALTEIIVKTARWQRNLFCAIVCSDDVKRGRPFPDMILKAMQICGITSANRVLNVGDTALDLQAGHRAGVRMNVGVLSGAHDRQRLEKEPHTHIVESITALPIL
jgi:phosphonatase-like hydrolase